MYKIYEESFEARHTFDHERRKLDCKSNWKIEEFQLDFVGKVIEIFELVWTI